MAEYTASLLLDLRDGVSRPAKSVVDMLREVDRELKLVDQQAARTRLSDLQTRGGNPLDIARLRLQIQKQGLEMERDAMSTLASGSMGLMDTARSFGPMLADGALIAATAIGSAGAALAVGVTSGLEKFTNFVTASSIFKENTLTTMSTLMGSKAAAESLIDDLVKLAAVTPYTTKETISFGTQFLGAGFKSDEIPVLLKGIGDLATITSSPMSKPETIRHIIGYVNRIKSMGTMDADVLRMMSEIGIPQGKFIEAIQAQTGLPDSASVRKAIENKKIGSELAITSLLQTAINIFGGLGEGMNKASQNLEGVFSTLASKPEEWAMTAQKGAGFAAIKSSVNDLNTVLNKRTPMIVARLNTLYDFIAKSTIGGLDTKSIESFVVQIENGFDRAYSYLQIVVPGIKGLISGIAEGAHLGELTLPETLTPESISQMADQAKRMGEEFGRTIGVLFSADGILMRMIKSTETLVLILQTAYGIGKIARLPLNVVTSTFEDLRDPLAIYRKGTGVGDTARGRDVINPVLSMLGLPQFKTTPQTPMTVNQVIDASGNASPDDVKEAAKQGGIEAYKWYQDNAVEIGYQG